MTHKAPCGYREAKGIPNLKYVLTVHLRKQDTKLPDNDTVYD